MTERAYPEFAVLLVDDEPAWLDSLSLSLERIAGITNTILCDDSRQVMDVLSRSQVGLVLLDLVMPHISGQELLKLIKEQHPQTFVIILTGMNQLDTAVSCMKSGAFDYFAKTMEVDRLVTGVLHAIRMIELEKENREVSRRLLFDTVEHPEAFAHILSLNKQMRSIFQYIESVARGTQPILITGESGVGKDLIARSIHSLGGRTGPMVCVNVAGLDDGVFADTLFGHVKGAFTGADTVRKGMVEEAADGVLFLDEIGDLSPVSQVKLLRLLNDGEYFPLGCDRPKRLRARVVVATNTDLPARIASGHFRKDLYYRLTTHRVHVPPLRERKEDLPLLLDHFLEEAALDLEKKKPTAPRELLQLLETYSFPGNVRELRSMTYDAVTQHKSGVLSLSAFATAMGRGAGSGRPLDSSLSCEETIYSALDALPTPSQAVSLLIDEAMKRAKGNQSLAARLLGMSQPALNKRIKKTGRQPIVDF